MPHTRGRVPPRYGARGPLGTILLINNRARSGSRYMARLRATGVDLGLDSKNNIRWMTVLLPTDEY